ncbi:MAG: NAD(P)H-hydrate dehydratase [Verrucomicrobia bacterium]|nr:NAD(P)H-hydrate dehydratase [Verrucomicrobiota bacterium]
MPIPVLTVDQMREWEQATWATGTTEQSVIQQVGQKLARRLLTLTRPGDSILLLAGKGHNGEDARAAARHLADRSVQTLDLHHPAEDLAKLQQCLSQRPNLIVDGLFGIGLDRPLDAAWSAIVRAVNDSGLTVLSVDVPSGLPADTGDPAGVAIQAHITLTVGAPKAGLIRHAAAPYVGKLEVATDIGLIPCYHHPDLWWTLPGDFVGFPPRRPANAHKGLLGHLSIVAGSLGYQGAAVLAARGAQRARPGLITLNTQEIVFPVAAAQLQGVMVTPWQPAALDHGSAMLMGPGLAGEGAEDEVQQPLRKLWSKDGLQPIVADATALNWLPMGMTTPNQLRVVTPHPGEAARMLNAKPEHVQADRLSALRKISARFGDCWVILKGQHTLVGRSSGEVYVNSSGNAGMAQGGTGDVLAGYVAGLLAQPELGKDPLTTLRYAVWQHGAAADLLEATRPNWVAEDLADRIGRVSPFDLQL